MREAGTPVDRAPQAVAAFPPAVDGSGVSLLLEHQVGNPPREAGKCEDQERGSPPQTPSRQDGEANR